MTRITIAALAAAATFLTVPAFAQNCGGDFGGWRNGLVTEAGQKGVGAKGQQYLASARQDSSVLKRDRAQGVFTQDFLTFSGRMVSSYRLKHGANNLKKYAKVFKRAEQEFGVPGPVITAFWALETDFGAVQGDFSTLNALATLAHDCRRPELFRPQLIALAKLVELGALPPNVKGAWAGEIGQIQILPSDYFEFGRDGDGDGTIDLRRSEPDVILTAANFIRSLGWKANQPWLQEVTVPDQLPWENSGITKRLPVSQWQKWGVKARSGSLASNLDASLVLPMGRKGPAFLAYPNFNVFLEWNQSLTYVLTAAYFSTRLGGAPIFTEGNPEPGLNQAQMKQLQTKLNADGFDVGKIDGILGAGTREAVRQEQLRLGLPADAWPTRTLLNKL